MPAISLVVCVHRQRDLLERLLRESRNCYDDLVVEHDIPDVQDVRSVVEAVGGQFFERPPAASQEPHWPFAWGQAKHDWILRLDADEFPSEEMKIWLQEFRRAPEPPEEISGFTCIWPLWDGQRMVSKKWPSGRIFLFHKQRVRFFGMGEQVPIPDGKYEPLDLVLHHQPKGKAYSLYNALTKHPRGRAFITASLLGRPTDLACWRWENEEWPVEWEQIRQHPLRTALKRLVMGTFRGLRSQWKVEKKISPLVAIGGAIYHAQMCLEFWRQQRNRGGQK
ncbi:MAG: hypothetical protein ABSD57_01600 [Verrucomicrobiota bacterium]|jgi:hypothetical protein